MAIALRQRLGKDFICSAITAIACPDPVAAAVFNSIDVKPWAFAYWIAWIGLKFFRSYCIMPITVIEPEG